MNYLMARSIVLKPTIFSTEISNGTWKIQQNNCLVFKMLTKRVSIAEYRLQIQEIRYVRMLYQAILEAMEPTSSSFTVSLTSTASKFVL